MEEKANELLMECAEIFKEMDDVIWNEDSVWQVSSYENTASRVYSYLNELKKNKTNQQNSI